MFFFGFASFVTGSSEESRYHYISDADLSSVNSSGYYTTGSATIGDQFRTLYGFGDESTYALHSDGYYVGTNHRVGFVEAELSLTASFNDTNHFYAFKPVIRGWKYGVHNGLPEYSKAYFRRNHYGQFRDMLEQRPFTRYYKTPVAGWQSKAGVGPETVTVKFVDSFGQTTNPENTSSQNLSSEATSSLPYFDGQFRNRSEIDHNVQNSNIISLQTDLFKNLKVE